MQRVIGLLALWTLPLALAAGDDARLELKALQGKWKMVAGEAAGKPFAKDAVPVFMFVIGADGKSVGQTPQSQTQSRISVDPKKDPKTIDNLHESGEQKGKKQHGIYKLEGDELTVCMTPPGRAEADRPKEFSSKNGINVVFVFQRVKDEKKP